MDGLEGQERADAFAFKMNAKVVKGAEAHFRLMARQGPDSWNARVDHFYAVADRLLQFYGASARGIVWAHNTHIGDARFTTSGQRGERNIGQLARQRLGEEQVVAVGFGTHRGTVQAGRSWGAPMETMTVPPGGAGSLEALMHQVEKESALFIFDERVALAPLMEVIGHRAIGVIYHPEREFPGNYVPTIVPRRYDAFIFIDETKALQPVAP
jgi:erythromycin esterase-like protein